MIQQNPCWGEDVAAAAEEGRGGRAGGGQPGPTGGSRSSWAESFLLTAQATRADSSLFQSSCSGYVGVGEAALRLLEATPCLWAVIYLLPSLHCSSRTLECRALRSLWETPGRCLCPDPVTRAGGKRQGQDRCCIGCLVLLL